MGLGLGNHTCASLMAPVDHYQALSCHQRQPLGSTRMEVKSQLISSPTFNATGQWLVPPPASSFPALRHHLPTHLGRVSPWSHRILWLPH